MECNGCSCGCFFYCFLECSSRRISHYVCGKNLVSRIIELLKEVGIVEFRITVYRAVKLGNAILDNGNRIGIDSCNSFNSRSYFQYLLTVAISNYVAWNGESVCLGTVDFPGADVLNFTGCSVKEIFNGHIRHCGCVKL